MEILGKRIGLPYVLIGALAIGWIASVIVSANQHGRLNVLNTQIQNLNDTISSLQSNISDLQSKNSDLRKEASSYSNTSTNVNGARYIQVSNVQTPQPNAILSNAELFDVAFVITNDAAETVYHVDCTGLLVDSNGQSLGSQNTEIPEIGPGQSVQYTVQIPLTTNANNFSASVRVTRASFTQ